MSLKIKRNKEIAATARFLVSKTEQVCDVSQTLRYNFPVAKNRWCFVMRNLWYYACDILHNIFVKVPAWNFSHMKVREMVNKPERRIATTRRGKTMVKSWCHITSWCEVTCVPEPKVMAKSIVKNSDGGCPLHWVDNPTGQPRHLLRAVIFYLTILAILWCMPTCLYYRWESVTRDGFVNFRNGLLIKMLTNIYSTIIAYFVKFLGKMQS